MSDVEFNNNGVSVCRERVYRYELSNKVDNFSISTSICVVFSLLILLGVFATYITFMVISLIKTTNEHIKLTCADSNLWPYVLVILISALTINIGIIRLEKNKNNNIKNIGNILSFLHSIGMFLWGYYEVLYNKCVETNFDSSLIFEMAFANMIIYIFISFISFCCLCYRVICN